MVWFLFSIWLGKFQPEIIRVNSNIFKWTVCLCDLTIKWYNDTGNIAKYYHGDGPKRTAASPEIIQNEISELEQNQTV